MQVALITPDAYNQVLPCSPHPKLPQIVGCPQEQVRDLYNGRKRPEEDLQGALEVEQRLKNAQSDMTACVHWQNINMILTIPNAPKKSS